MEVKETEVLEIYQPLPVTVYSVANCRPQFGNTVKKCPTPPDKKAERAIMRPDKLVHHILCKICILPPFQPCLHVIHSPLSDFSRNPQEIKEQAGEYYGWNKHYKQAVYFMFTELSSLVFKFKLNWIQLQQCQKNAQNNFVIHFVKFAVFTYNVSQRMDFLVLQ